MMTVHVLTHYILGLLVVAVGVTDLVAALITGIPELPPLLDPVILASAEALQAGGLPPSFSTSQDPRGV